MIITRIINNKQYSPSCIIFYDYTSLDVKCSFLSKDSYPILIIKVNKAFKFWQMRWCHELGHCYFIDKTLARKVTVSQIIRWEVMAWRLAKSFCKPKFWNDKEVIQSLKTYKPYNYMINWKKFRIIPLNRGFKLK